MLPLPDLPVYFELIVLFLACLPLGGLLLRSAERFLGRSIALTPTERVLLAFFSAGGLLFVVASLPFPIYDFATVVGILVAGGIGYGTVALSERASGLREILGLARTVPGLLLGLGSLALLAVELTSGNVVLPNGVDGSMEALYVNQLLSFHSVAWTLEPYASVGVIYPQGAAVWMSVPVLLFGWPIVAAPVVLPPLFLSLTPAAAFCLGERLGRSATWPRGGMGLLFAGFFGLVASWPRLYVGGSYDFVFALPLFLVLLGLLRPMAEALPSWREAILIGCLLGITTVLSGTVGTVILALLLLQTVLTWRPQHDGLLRRLAGFGISAGVVALFLVRSFAGAIVWWDYPGHVLTSNSVRPYSPLVNQTIYGDLPAEVNPFTPWKWKLSPFPLLSLELQVLLAAGLVLSILVLVRARGVLVRYLPRDIAESAVANTAVVLGLIGIVAIGRWVSTSKSGIQSVSNLWELSILLFVLYSILALLPVVAAANYLREVHAVRASRTPGSNNERSPRPAPGRPEIRPRRPWATALMVVVVVLPMASGAAVTAAEVPQYLHSYLQGQSNGTSDDVVVLQWAGAHLPGCSGVLVAPGSAAQFLPEYAAVKLIYPAYPTPSNLTYYNVVTNLTNGTYGTGTRDGMLALGVTEVFVTGATTNSYAPFSPVPLLHSPDFSLLDSAGDALLFGFEPGIVAASCAPS